MDLALTVVVPNAENISITEKSGEIDLAVRIKVGKHQYLYGNLTIPYSESLSLRNKLIELLLKQNGY